MAFDKSRIGNIQPPSLLAAFPAQLSHDVTQVDHIVRNRMPSLPGTSIFVQGEALQIPYRVYYTFDEEQFGHLSENQAIIYACIFTRHHNGYIRQRQIEHLISSSLPWVAPFMFLLCGEYVIQILDTIESNLRLMNGQVYRSFIQENELLYMQTRDRMISYWDCYYRRLYKKRSDYVGYRLFDQFKEWAD